MTKPQTETKKHVQFNLRISQDQYALLGALAEQKKLSMNALIVSWLDSAIESTPLSVASISGVLTEDGVEILKTASSKRSMAQIDECAKTSWISDYLAQEAERKMKTTEGVQEFKEKLIYHTTVMARKLCELTATELEKSELLEKLDVPYVASLPYDYVPLREIAKWHEDNRGIGVLDSFRKKALKSESLMEEIRVFLDQEAVNHFLMSIFVLRSNRGSQASE